MKHYDYQKPLQQLWEKGVRLYKEGTDKQQWFDETELSFLASIGMNLQELFDFCEDFVDGGDPDFITVALVQDIRRSYFLDKQGGQPSGKEIDMSTLPAKDAEVDGIVWLPRIIEKAHAKIRGEMPPELMYGCGGDRKFLKTHDIHPAEFLRAVVEREDDRDAIVAWVKKRMA